MNSPARNTCSTRSQTIARARATGTSSTTCGQVREAELAVGEDRVAREHVGLPQRKHPALQLLADPLGEREIEEAGVELVKGRAAEQAVAVQDQRAEREEGDGRQIGHGSGADVAAGIIGGRERVELTRRGRRPAPTARTAAAGRTESPALRRPPRACSIAFSGAGGCHRSGSPAVPSWRWPLTRSSSRLATAGGNSSVLAQLKRSTAKPGLPELVRDFVARIPMAGVDQSVVLAAQPIVGRARAA